jgi:hypothetical protein
MYLYEIYTFFKMWKKSKANIIYKKTTWLAPKYLKWNFCTFPKSISIVAKQVSIIDANQTCFIQTKPESRT